MLAEKSISCLCHRIDRILLHIIRKKLETSCYDCERQDGKSQKTWQSTLENIAKKQFPTLIPSAHFGLEVLGTTKGKETIKWSWKLVIIVNLAIAKHRHFIQNWHWSEVKLPRFFFFFISLFNSAASWMHGSYKFTSLFLLYVFCSKEVQHKLLIIKKKTSIHP